MKSIYVYSVWVIIVISFFACNVSKDIITPVPELPATFASQDSDTVSVADMPWKIFFPDPTLRDLIDSAIQKNYDMQIALDNIEQARLLYKQVKWNNIPTVDLGVTASTNRPADNSLTGLSLQAFGVDANHIEDYSANVAIGWEADIWGKIRNQNKSALANYLQSTEARKAIQTSIVSTVAQGYYNLLMLHAQLEIAERNAALTDSTLHIIHLQFDFGQVTSLAVQQAEAQNTATAELIPQFEQYIAIQENGLRVLSGQLPSTITMTTTLESSQMPQNLSSGLPSEILKRRPDIKSRELALTIANANVGIRKADMYPALRITASGGINSFKASNWFNIPASLFGVVGGSVFQPVLEHKELKTQFEVTKIERDKTVTLFRQSVINAVGEVSDALVKIDKFNKQQFLAVSRVNTLQIATGNAGMLFKNGLATYLEVLTAQGSVLQSELELATIKRSGLAAATELYVALGGGWR